MENTIKSLIAESIFYLKKDVINQQDFLNYKSKLEDLMICLLKENPSSDIKENIERLLSQKVHVSNNFFLCKWIYSFITLKNSIHFNAPFLRKHSISDNYKKYIFWSKLGLEGILYKYSNVSKSNT